MKKYFFIVMMAFSALAKADPAILGSWYTEPSKQGQIITLNSLMQYEADGTATMQAVFPGKNNKVVAKFLVQYGESTYTFTKLISKTNCPFFNFGSFEGHEYTYSVNENILVESSWTPQYSDRATPTQVAFFEGLEEGCN